MSRAQICPIKAIPPQPLAEHDPYRRSTAPAWLVCARALDRPFVGRRAIGGSHLVASTQRGPATAVGCWALVLLINLIRPLFVGRHAITRRQRLSLLEGYQRQGTVVSALFLLITGRAPAWLNIVACGSGGAQPGPKLAAALGSGRC